MMFSRSALFLMACLTLPLPALGQETAPAAGAETPTPLPDMAEIEQAWARGDYVFVRQGLKRLAEEVGTPLAQYRYGRILAEGRGGPRDMTAARDWLERAVAQNHLEAAVLLARIYLSAQSDDPDTRAAYEARAIELLQSSAARGNAEGQYYLALMYRAGRGVEADATQAFTWFLAAAENQYVPAQYELSQAYSRGLGTEMNTDEALRWLTEAAVAGHLQAQLFLGIAYDSGLAVAENKVEAAQWYTRAAEAGQRDAQRLLGRKYLRGEGVMANPGEGLRWLTTAAAADDVVAMVWLGEAYLEGDGLPVDPARAWAWFARAHEYTSGAATMGLAKMTERGLHGGAGPDLDQAVAFYRQALERGHAPAALRLGQLAGEGKLEGRAPPHVAVPWAVLAVAEGDSGALSWLEAQAAAGLRPAQTALGLIRLEAGDPAAAAALFAPAAEAGDTEAQYQLGLLLTRGEGVELDYVAGHSWLNIAAASGHGQAGETRDLIGDLMTPDQVAEAQTRARDFFETARTRPPVSE